jgi:hypothetical protein
MDDHTDRVETTRIAAEADVFSNAILKTPAPSVIVPAPRYFFAFAYIFQVPAAM